VSIYEHRKRVAKRVTGISVPAAASGPQLPDDGRDWRDLRRGYGN